MAGGTKKLIEVEEKAWTVAIPQMIIGGSIFLVCLVLLFIVDFLHLYFSVMRPSQILLSIGMGVGVAILGVAVYQAWKLRYTPSLSQVCPYCNHIAKFVEAPKVSYPCDACQRTVHFLNGSAAPIRQVVCPACKTEHTVAAHLDELVCDQCNRAIEVSKKRKPGTGELTDAMLQNYDVLLISFDKRKEIEIAQKLQNMMLINMIEARKMMSEATTNKPLTIDKNQPQRKAEAIRRTLQDMGAIVTLRPTSTGVPAKK